MVEMTSWSAIARKTTELVLEGRSNMIQVSKNELWSLDNPASISVQSQSSHITFPHTSKLKGRRCKANFPPCMARTGRHVPGGWSMRFMVPAKNHRERPYLMNRSQWASRRPNYALLAHFRSCQTLSPLKSRQGSPGSLWSQPKALSHTASSRGKGG